MGRTIKITRAPRPDFADVGVGLVPTPGGRLGDPSSRNISPRENWVDQQGGMPEYMKMVRNALLRQGHSMQRATAIAVNTMKRWARGGGHVHPQVQAAAAAALAQWEAMRGAAHADDAVKGAKKILKKARKAASEDA